MKRIFGGFSLIGGLGGFLLLIIQMYDCIDSRYCELSDDRGLFLFIFCVSLLFFIFPIINKFWVPTELKKLQKIEQENELLKKQIEQKELKKKLNNE